MREESVYVLQCDTIWVVVSLDVGMVAFWMRRLC